MTEEEKWNQEAFNLGVKYYLNLPSLAAFKDGYLQGHRDENKERQEEIALLKLDIISLKDTVSDLQREVHRRREDLYADVNKIQEEIERLNKYEKMWINLKAQLKRDREAGFLEKTARAWLLMQEFEEAK